MRSVGDACAGICGHFPPATRQPRDLRGGGDVSGKCGEMGEPSDHQVALPAVKCCLRNTAWHSFSQIFWQFEQTSRKLFWFLAPMSHLWRRVRSAACALSLKYPSFPEMCVACFPGCGTGYCFHSTKSPFPLHTPLTIPNPTSGWGERKHHPELAGVKGSITHNYCTATCLRRERACACNALICARFR